LKLVETGDLSIVVAIEISRADKPADQIKLAKRAINMSANFARQFVRERIKKHGLSSITRKREHSPKDDYRKLRSFVYRTIDSLNIILGLCSEKIIGLFYNREGKDKEMILEYLDKIILKLKKLRDTIYNEGSIGMDVRDSIRKLWEDDGK